MTTTKTTIINRTFFYSVRQNFGAEKGEKKVNAEIFSAKRFAFFILCAGESTSPLVRETTLWRGERRKKGKRGDLLCETLCVLPSLRRNNGEIKKVVRL